ncbi:MAG: thymidine phosphorylase, partial [Armatimonadetes bacterium]|nr:thymidine phosphorylase [Anaerolineae bacterium]
MRAVDIIAKKRDGYALTDAEITWFVAAATRDEVKDYQVAAFLMAVYLRGMTRDETVSLTLAMAHSGDTFDLSDVVDYAVDKHSSGGVGDKTSLIVLPLVASCGVTVAKMSGRGLGLSGGTLDKLDAIAGFRSDLSEADFKHNARQHGLVLAGQTRQLAPADGQFYALRDVTATVSCLPLIVSSIMSKKIAAGANGIVLDVKAGSGAFMKTVTEAEDLARSMVEIGVSVGRDMIAVVSDMNQPLGQYVGNALEVLEAIEILRDGGDADLREHCLQVAAHMLRLAGQGALWNDDAAVRSELEAQLANGAAFEKLREMVSAQGGDVRMIDDPALLPQAAIFESYTAAHDGYIAQVDAEAVAIIAFELGAGREKKTDDLDLAVGARILVKVGGAVSAGQPLMTLFANDADKLARAQEKIAQAFAIVQS